MTPRPLRAGRPIVLLLTLTCVACSPTVSEQPLAEPSPTPSATSSSAHEGHSGSPSATATTPVEIRLQMEKLLGQHAILMVRVLRGHVDGESQFVQAADATLQRNTDEVTAAVSSAYGTAAGDSFAELWADLVTALTDYGKARAADDEAMLSDATRALDAYAVRFGESVSKLTEQQFTARAATRAMKEHIGHLVKATDAYADENFVAAFAGERRAYAGMFPMAQALSGPAVSDAAGELPPEFNDPSAQLRSGLGQLLGEHAELVFDATRAVVSGTASAEAGAAALNANTEDIVAAMQAALDADVAKEFSAGWGDHIDAIVNFAVAVAEKDDEGQARARAAMEALPVQLGEILPGISGGSVASASVISAIKLHDQQLLQQVTAYAARDYRTANELAYDGYHHMFAVASTLATALEADTAGGAPLGGAATGGGGSFRR